MGKIICDICGTTYQDTAECCPICGCSRDAAASLLGDDLLMEDILEEPKTKGGRFSSKKKKEIFDYDEVNSELDEEPVEEEENPYDGEEEYEQPGKKHNSVAVVLLTALICVLLLAAGFLFVKFYLPNMRPEETVPPTAPQVQSTTTETEPVIPCQSLMLTSATTAELGQEGNYFLIHAQALPENTTDKIVYTSADESIATVTEDGRITAVAEGETQIFITCGNMQTTCKVICNFTPETVPPTVETTPVTQAPEETVPATTLPAVTLKLKQTDFKLGVYYEHQLMLDCGLEQNQVEWRSEHPHIASVDENGVVKALKSGTTSIIAKYGDQEVSCIVRCG